MAKRIEIDGKFYRKRRGKLVEIPSKWVGREPTKQTIRKRPSKLTGKVKRIVKDVARVGRYKDKKAQGEKRV
jgi:hypothetical protein